MEHVVTCPVCAQGQLVSKESTTSLSFDSRTFSVPHKFHQCDFCMVEMALPSDTRMNARATIKAKKEAKGRVPGSTYREVRAAASFTQAVAGKVIGGGPVAFSKYENDEIEASDAMDNLVWLLHKHPSLTEDLALRHGFEIKNVANFDTKPEISVTKIDTGTSRILATSIMATILNSRSGLWPQVHLMENLTAEPANQSRFQYTPSLVG